MDSEAIFVVVQIYQMVQEYQEEEFPLQQEFVDVVGHHLAAVENYCFQSASSPLEHHQDGQVPGTSH